MSLSPARSDSAAKNPELPLYCLWNSHRNAAETGIELPQLVQLAQDKKIARDSWIYSVRNQSWTKAFQLPELELFFNGPTSGTTRKSLNDTALLAEPALLRRIKIFAHVPEAVLESFVQCMELLQVSPFATVVRKGAHGDAMFFVLEGELRARIIIDGRETILTTLAAGDFFGEISLLDEGPRSADVVANEESTLLKLSARSLERIVEQAPELASSVLLAISRSIVLRVRTTTKRYEDSIQFWRAGASGTGTSPANLAQA